MQQDLQKVKLFLKAAAFDRKSAYELSKITSPETLWALKLTTSTFYVAGLLAGIRRGVRRSRQFLAENSHRMPTTKGGWFEYRKQKNFEIIKSSFPHGVMYGLSAAGWTAVYCTGEYGIDLLRKEYNLNDGYTFANTTVSAFDKLWLTSAKTVILAGTGSGLAIGLLQDLYQEMNGKSIKQMVVIEEKMEE
ncbi:hypothetical protein HK103_002935 [Boothiomyces macroporosus]|uniref:Uncharacterized protein n=1 Tax=Boothiomyces macroporosus TaxID=261099 RepID=A0AAD5Y481_9FUNG|nr:hypothetical protein HK103_002935 [Boothiomyces macroporosus]